MTCAGRSRSRSLALPVSARTSRTWSSGNVPAITPRLMWSLTRMPAGRPAGARAIVAAHPRATASMAQLHPDTAGEIGSGGERGEAGGAGGGTRDGPEPIAQAAEVDRGRRRHVLQAGPAQPAVARPPQPEAADALREAALDPAPRGVAAAARLGRELPACRL